jgi:hypothetical protein
MFNVRDSGKSHNSIIGQVAASMLDVSWQTLCVFCRAIPPAFSPSDCWTSHWEPPMLERNSWANGSSTNLWQQKALFRGGHVLSQVIESQHFMHIFRRYGISVSES